VIGADDDATLMRRHVEGDPDAFGEIVRRHRDRLWAVAIRTLGNPEDAADALQDALVNAFRRAGSFRAESAVTTWLHRIVVNACIDRVRRTAARPVVVLADDVDAASPGPDPGTQTALRLDVEAALATLPHEQRVPLVLVDMEGYPVSEVAEMLGCPVGTVKSRCARARARLLPLLTSHGSRDPLRGNQATPADVPSTPAYGSGGEPP
jgi:RNA polymerase sigma-70 factor, ECF subfamily